ncbi:UNVERIFIED_CONTAM: hypothetical protein GTU68_044836, partial [Idotea baltica]|nr:hypothetical protein [Idotea baltica]
MKTQKTYLIILDGVGIAPDGPGNAVSLAQKPFLDALWADNSLAQLQTHGEIVGLPSFQMGGSEVGHLTIGAGRTIQHILTTINDDLETGAIAAKPELQKIITKAKEKSRIHLLGMVSDGGIHSFLAHLLALQKLCKNEGIEDICIHAITDGRDVGQRSCVKFLQAVQDQGIGRIVSIGGRFYPMDRDDNWERTEKGYRVFCDSKTAEDNRSWEEVVKDHYENTEDSDYYLEPVLLDKSGQIEEDDAVVCFNFRTDRMRQIMSVFCDAKFSHFDRPVAFNPDNFAIFGNYYPEAHTVYEIKDSAKENTLGEVLEKNNLSQLRVTETEKFNHVTFFFSG